MILICFVYRETIKVYKVVMKRLLSYVSQPYYINK